MLPWLSNVASSSLRSLSKGKQISSEIDSAVGKALSAVSGVHSLLLLKDWSSGKAQRQTGVLSTFPLAVVSILDSFAGEFPESRPPN